MESEYGVKLQIEPKMFQRWQRYTQWTPEIGRDEGEIDTLRLVSSMAFQSLAKIPEETRNGVEIEIRVKESPTKLPLE